MSNPILNENFLKKEKVHYAEPVADENAARSGDDVRAYRERTFIAEEPMTVNGAINKTFVLFGCLLLAAMYTWNLMMNGFTDKAVLLCYGGAIVGFVLAMILAFSNARGAKFLAPAYAVAEGFFVGGISAMFEASWAGIVMQAVVATMAAMVSMLLLYRLNIIRATEKFRSVIFISTLSIAVIYLIQFIASFFGRGIPQIFTASPMGIGFSLLAVAIAALNLIIDFDFIDRGAAMMLEKRYEWYGAFGLMVTLVWLYLEMLRLLAKMSSRD